MRAENPRHCALLTARCVAAPEALRATLREALIAARRIRPTAAAQSSDQRAKACLGRSRRPRGDEGWCAARQVTLRAWRYCSNLPRAASRCVVVDGWAARAMCLTGMLGGHPRRSSRPSLHSDVGARCTLCRRAALRRRAGRRRGHRARLHALGPRVGSGHQVIDRRRTSVTSTMPSGYASGDRRPELAAHQHGVGGELGRAVDLDRRVTAAREHDRTARTRAGSRSSASGRSRRSEAVR